MDYLNATFLHSYKKYGKFCSLRLRVFSASLRNLHAENNHENRWAYKQYRAFQGVSVLTAEFALLTGYTANSFVHYRNMH